MTVERKLSEEDLDDLEKRYTAEPIPDCRVCGAKLTIASMGGGHATVYKCPEVYKNGFKKLGSVEDQGQSTHYSLSEHRDLNPGDWYGLMLVQELKAWRAEADR